MIRRSFRIGLLAGLVAGIAVAVSKARQRRESPASSTETWPPIEAREPQAPGPVPARPVVDADEIDTTVAPGPDPQPARQPDDVAAQAPSPAADELPAPQVHTSEGAEAEAVSSDTDRQPDVATPDWTASDMELDDRPTAEPAAGDETPAESPGRRQPAAARRAAKKGPASKAATPQSSGGRLSARGEKKAAAKKAAAKKPATKKPASKKAGTKKAAGTEAAAETERPGAARWVEPDAAGTCPTSHPVKAKMASKIFHLPGMLNYERTRPDRCYVDADAAEADGLRGSKR